MKTITIKGTEVPEERVLFALQFLEDMEKRFGTTNFIQSKPIQEVGSNV